MSHRTVRIAAKLCLGQGVYFLVTGLWPLVHMRSFLKVTGPKVDLWLVNTVGLLVTSMGIGFLIAAKRQSVTPALKTIAINSALGLGFIDLRYAMTNHISKVYLADAAIEGILLALWAKTYADKKQIKKRSLR